MRQSLPERSSSTTTFSGFSGIGEGDGPDRLRPAGLLHIDGEVRNIPILVAHEGIAVQRRRLAALGRARPVFENERGEPDGEVAAHLFGAGERHAFGRVGRAARRTSGRSAAGTSWRTCPPRHGPAGRGATATNAASPARMERRDHAAREELPDVMNFLAGSARKSMVARDGGSLPDRLTASIRCNPGDLAVATGRAKCAWRRRDLGLSLNAPVNSRAGTPRNLHARHAASDYDEHATRAIAILREVDECLLTEGPRRFTRPEVFVAGAVLAHGGRAADMFGAPAQMWCRTVAHFRNTLPDQRPALAHLNCALRYRSVRSARRSG